MQTKKRSAEGDVQVGDAEASKNRRLKVLGRQRGSVVAVGVDHGFSNHYKKNDEPFVNDRDSCADMFWLIRGSSCDLPSVD